MEGGKTKQSKANQAPTTTYSFYASSVIHINHIIVINDVLNTAVRWHSPIRDRYQRDSDGVTVPFNQAAADDRISHCLASDCSTNLILISSPLHWTGQPRF
ncbi:hypothetical protein Trydic_g17086 [Trypoxylus dichotomus]